LVRGREQDRIGVGPQQLVQPDATGVDSDADRLQAGAGGALAVSGLILLAAATAFAAQPPREPGGRNRGSGGGAEAR
jgi:hypothetical protein